MEYEKKHKPLQILLDPDTHAKFKTLCAIRGVKMTEVTKEMIEGWITNELKTRPWVGTSIK